MSAIHDPIAEITNFLENPSLHAMKTPLEFSEESLSALYAMAYELYRNGKYEDAKGFFRLLTLADSFERKYWMGLAACYQMLKCYPEAIECYSAAAIQNPDDPYVHWHAADCFFHAGNLTQAKEAIASALITASDNKMFAPLIPKLELISNTWSSLSQETYHA